MVGNSWIYNFLTPKEIDSISHAVAAAESGTSGEIVPIIVRRSTPVGHLSNYLMFVFIGLFFVSGCYDMMKSYFTFGFSSFLGAWGIYITFAVYLVTMYFISRVLSQQKFIQRLLTSKLDRKYEVEERALLEFYINHVAKTEHKTGIMIFISLMEQQTVVLADEAISKNYPQDTWNEIVQIIISNIKNKKTAAGLEEAILKCGDILKKHLPATNNNKNELSNKLIIKD